MTHGKLARPKSKIRKAAEEHGADFRARAVEITADDHQQQSHGEGE